MTRFLPHPQISTAPVRWNVSAISGFPEFAEVRSRELQGSGWKILRSVREAGPAYVS